MPIDNPTKHVTYKIFTPIHVEDIGERWTDSVEEAQEALDRGFSVDRVDIVRAIVSTGQTVTTGITTEWRGK